MNQIFNRKYDLREKTYRKTCEIDNDLFTFLEKCSEYYDATISQLFNTCLEHLIETENIRIFEKAETTHTAPHTLYVKERNLKGIGKLKAKYNVSIYKLNNIAIKNVMDAVEKS